MNKKLRFDFYCNWLLGGDTGASSKSMLAIAIGYPMEYLSLPRDGGDFGRCYRLIKRFPELMENIRDNLSGLDQEWKNFIKAWDEISEQYERHIEKMPTARPNPEWRKLQELIDYHTQ